MIKKRKVRSTITKNKITFLIKYETNGYNYEAFTNANTQTIEVDFPNDVKQVKLLV